MIPVKKNAVYLKVLLKKYRWSSVKDKHGIFVTDKNQTMQLKTINVEDYNYFWSHLFKSLYIQ